MIDMALIASAVPQLIAGALITLQIAFFASLIGFVGGICLGILHAGNAQFINLMIWLYVTIIRGTPMLLQIMFFFFMLPKIGIYISPFWTAVIAIGINSSAYISQIVKSGIASVSHGQTEAALTLGISSYDITRYIVLPQALSIVIPALGSEFITLIKDSALASLIGVVELYKRGDIIISQTYNALGIYTLVGLGYLIITSLVSVLFLKLEHYHRKPHARN